MITTSINIKEHLAQYAKVVFEEPGKSYIRIPHQHDLYHILAFLMQKRPNGVPIRKGNLDIALPAQSRGKCPQTYNYISDRSTAIIEEKIECLFWAHVHDFVDERHHRFGEQMNSAIYMFMRKFKITAITEDALSKNYYRWRWQVRRKRRKRNYNSPK